MAVNFYIEKRLNKKGEAAIRCSISIQGHRLVTTTGFSIHPGLWDNTTQRVITSLDGKAVYNSKGVSSKFLNARLKKIDSYFSDLENSLWATHENVGDLKSIFQEVFGKEKVVEETVGEEVTGFFDIYDMFTREMSAQNDWSASTNKKMKTLRNHLYDFKQGLSFEDLNEEGLNGFLDFLRDKCDFRNSTILKTLKQLKWFLRWADLHDYCKETAFKRFSPKLKSTDRKIVFLEWEELMKVYNFEFPAFGTKLKLKDVNGAEYEKSVAVGPETLDHVRDIFCFCCFTSLRYSDVENLKRSNIFPGYIQIVTVKTTDSLKIELNDYAQAILDKYKDTKFPYNRVLPVITNQRMNEYLKEMGELCGFNTPETVTYYKGNKRIDEVYPKWALIGTHTGRRTFICNALMMGIPPQVVMKWTGHSDYKAMKPYIDISDSAKAEAMKKFNK